MMHAIMDTFTFRLDYAKNSSASPLRNCSRMNFM